MKKTQYSVVLILLVGVLLVGCPSRIGPDPAVINIKYELRLLTSPHSGTVRIIGEVQNVGTQPFLSGENQQSILLYEYGVDGARLVAGRVFQNLDVRETIQLTHDVHWDKLDEFRPQHYEVAIAYDPDILMDGNPDNDDVQIENNGQLRNTYGIDMLFNQ